MYNVISFSIMANRSYLYTVSEVPDYRKGGQVLTVKGLSEYKSGIPPVFLLLLGDNTIVCNSLIWDSYAVSGDYDQGVKNLEKFTELMLKKGVQNPEAFERVSKEAINYLNRQDIRQKFSLLEYGEIYQEIGYDEQALKENIILKWKDLLVALHNENLTKFNEYIGDDILTHWEDKAGIDYWEEVLYFHFSKEIEFYKPKTAPLEPTNKPLFELHLIPRDIKQNIAVEFGDLLSYFKRESYEIHEISKTKYSVIREELIRAEIELVSDGKEQSLKVKKDNIIVRCFSYSASISLTTRSFAANKNYKVYNSVLKSFLPSYIAFMDLTGTVTDPETIKILDKYGLEPIFLSDNDIYFVRKKREKPIYIVNPNLIDYYLRWKNYDKADFVQSPEFYYEVAPDIQRFVQYVDRNVIPTFFYQKYHKDLKIFNFSGVDIENPGRKVFVKPFIAEVDDENFNIHTIQGEKGAMILMDKIREGETLDKMLNRILKEWGVADGYLRAFVRKDLEFDKDREGYITPRLIVDVYVEKILKKPAGSERSWVPIPK